MRHKKRYGGHNFVLVRIFYTIYIQYLIKKYYIHIENGRFGWAQ